MTVGHATAGTQRRPSHTLSGDGLIFNLSHEMDALRPDLGRTSGSRSAKTLAKAGGLRVTMVMLAAGATLMPEGTAGGASLQVLDGRLRFADGTPREVGPGEVIVLATNLHEPIQAVEQSTFLVTVAWPAGAGAWDQEAAAGHL
jgi:quercetin dioxygenase-like cupin family protein